jgi:hypothetical protein
LARWLPVWIGWLLVLAGAGCVSSSAPVAMTSLAGEHDQPGIASYYAEQARRMRQKAEELRNTALLYEELFGPHSQEVKSVLMLAEFYESVAEHREKEAHLHLEAAGPLIRLNGIVEQAPEQRRRGP